jgi:SAM-dependent MidA family methyltransferase
MSPYIPWIDAWESAAFGPVGFYGEFGSKGGKPYEHFRTAVVSNPDLAAELFPYLLETYKQCGSPAQFLVLDVGGSNGSLISKLQPFIHENGLNWKTQIFDVSSGDARRIPIREKYGVVIAHELLDDIPTTVVEYDEDLLPRMVLVDPISGHEQLGESVSQMELEWLMRWWPQTVPHARREIGITRDHTWVKLVEIFSMGRAIGIDYSHSLNQRVSGFFDAGTLTGYRLGESVRAIPNGEINLTAHVALDSCASAAIASRPDITATLIKEVDSDHNDFRWLVQDFGSRS